MYGFYLINNSMKLPDLATFIGNAKTVEILKRAIEQDRLPHAMIFAGPAGVGKCTLALLLAQYLNCLSPTQNGGCGACSACKRISAVLASRGLQCQSQKGEASCGSCPACKLKAMRHPDVRLIEPEKSTISIGQVRDMISEIAFQPFEARYRVTILDPAEQMRLEAHNSLLKTLEEPPSRTIIILVTANPYMLLETIRSRSRLLRFGEIHRDQITKHLITAEKWTADDARLAAVMSGGSLAAALTFNSKEYRANRKQALDFVVLLLKQGRFSEANELIAETTKEKQSFQSFMETVAALLQDIYYAQTAPWRIGQSDMIEQFEMLAGTVLRSTIVSAIQATENLRHELQYNVNRQLAIESMFLAITRTR
jgi:DNA polymerase III subunit delta'